MKRNRRDARQYAFQIIYANEFHQQFDEVIFPDGEINHAMDYEYASQIVKGVLAHIEEIDTRLEAFCQKRKLDRMDRVDRAILRIAVWELTYNDKDISPAIIINEAVQLAKSFGTDASYKLVNAILDNYHKSQQ